MRGSRFALIFSSTVSEVTLLLPVILFCVGLVGCFIQTFFVYGPVRMHGFFAYASTSYSSTATRKVQTSNEDLKLGVTCVNYNKIIEFNR